jgi:hypothetical protein
MLWVLGILAVLVYLYEQGGGSSSSGGGGIVAGWSNTMAGVMAKFENSNPAYNNPLAIQGTGDTGSTAGNGLGIFSTTEAGLAAGIQMLESWAQRFPGLTITQALARWQTGHSDLSDLSSDDQTKVNNEAGMVGSALGVDPDSTTLGDLSGADDDSDP